MGSAGSKSYSVTSVITFGRLIYGARCDYGIVARRNLVENRPQTRAAVVCFELGLARQFRAVLYLANHERVKLTLVCQVFLFEP